MAAKHGGWLLPPARYRHPGDLIRVIIAGLVLAGVLAVGVAAHATTYAGAGAAVVTAVAPSTVPGRVLAALVQVLFAAAAAAAIAVTLRYRRFRLLVGLAARAILASAALTGIIYRAGGVRPGVLAAGAGPWSWFTGASLAGPAVPAAAVAGTVTAAPWLSRPWRRTAWMVLWLAAVVRLVTGTASPVEVAVACAAGVTAGAGVLVLSGVPDRRIGPGGIAAALASAGLPVACVEPAAVEAKGSLPFIAATEDGKPLFIKVLGSDQRDADLLYRAYRFIRLRDVGDTRPAASLIQAVEHQALVAVMAERAGKFPVRILPDLDSREVVDPALMDDLVQLVPEYARSALGFFSLGRLSATSNAAAANTALTASVAGRGLAAARPARVQDANAENITPPVRRDVIARYGPRLLAMLNKVPALLDTGTLRALDARVELAGQGPRLVVGGWLRARADPYRE